jgi:hypothetical protein
LSMSEISEVQNASSLDVKPAIKRDEAAYGKIGQLTDWVMGDLNLHSEKDGHNAMDDINVVVNRVADCLPIEGGYGHASITEQLDFWSENRQLFDTARGGRQSAADLIDSREKIIGEIHSCKGRLRNAEYDEILIKTNGFLSTILNSKKLANLKLRGEALKKEIAEREPELRKTDIEFETNKQLLGGITSKIDCKLPAIVTGEILKDLEWEVSLLCFDHPEHPSLLASKTNPDGTQTKLLIDYDSTPSKFRSSPNIRSVTNQRYITGSRYAAEQKGFISKDDSWPLPFNEETFERFDNWYVDHVRNSGKDKIVSVE